MELIWELLIVVLINVIESTNITYNIDNATKIFNFYKQKYNKTYLDKIAEAKGLKNFVNNLNKMNTLNARATEGYHLYQWNSYADIDPEDFEVRFGVRIDPYDHVLNETSNKLLRGTPNNINISKLHDLTKANQLYTDYINKYNRKNYTKERDRTIHYYRFLKTLVENNRDIMKGFSRDIKEEADEIHEYEYFY